MTRLSNEEISRYSRQLLVSEIGVQGQSKILSSSVLVVGAGGLGSSVLLYLAAAGIGRLGIVDYDAVELSNLQRQIIHTEARVNQSKVESAKESIHQLNSNCHVEAFEVLLSSDNIEEIIKRFDIVVDATDNVATRYLLNDACVLYDKPLVSGSAIRMEGQLTVYHYENGPCYRCLFPIPPPPETVTNCSDGGVLGVVPGLVGCIQALEVLKIASGIGPSYSQKMLLIDALSGSFRNVKLRPKKSDCVVCGTSPQITKLIDYVEFCGSSPTDKTESLHLLHDSQRISPLEFALIRSKDPSGYILIDVRDPVQFNICHLPEAKNIPLYEIEKNKDIKDMLDMHKSIYIICRRGNDSQLAVKRLLELGISCKDINGGLQQWSNQVDLDFPQY